MALLGESAAAAARTGLEHDRVEGGASHGLAGAAEAASVSDLGERVSGEHRPGAVDRWWGEQPRVAAGELAQRAVDRGDLARR